MSPFLPLSRGGIGDSLERRPQEPELSRHPLRPSNLPLQPEARRAREAAGSYRYHGDVPKLSCLLPLGEAELPPSFGFGCSPEHRARGKPVGIAQGVPQHPGDTESPEHCAEPLKGRATPGHGGCHGTVCSVTDAE